MACILDLHFIILTFFFFLFSFGSSPAFADPAGIARLLWYWVVLCFAEPLVRIYYRNDYYLGLKHFLHI